MFLDHLKKNAATASPSFQEEVPQESNALRFLWGLADISEFAGCFCGGVLLALVCRLIPRLLVFYLFFVAAAVGYLWLLYKADEPRARRMARLCGLAIALSVLGGTWDGILLALSALSLWQMLALSAVTVGLLWVFIEMLRYRAGR